MGGRAVRVLAAALLVGSLAAAATVRLPDRGRIARVLDGDTLVVKAGRAEYRVRLIGVDAPEASESAKLDKDAARTPRDKAAILALGRRASDFTRKLCEGKVCRVEYDKANEPKAHRDSYGRLLAYVWIKDRQGKPRLLNAEIIRQGYARALGGFPFDRDLQDLFRRLQLEARARRRGLWARGADVPWPTLSRAAYVGNRRSKKFHLPSCSAVQKMSAENRVEFRTAAEAKAAGYVPCKLCKP